MARLTKKRKRAAAARVMREILEDSLNAPPARWLVEQFQIAEARNPAAAQARRVDADERWAYWRAEAKRLQRQGLMTELGEIAQYLHRKLEGTDYAGAARTIREALYNLDDPAARRRVRVRE
jgi:hypothetical protein